MIMARRKQTPQKGERSAVIGTSQTRHERSNTSSSKGIDPRKQQHSIFSFDHLMDSSYTGRLQSPQRDISLVNIEFVPNSTSNKENNLKRSVVAYHTLDSR